MITRKELVEYIRDIVNRDDRLKDSIEIVENLSSLLKTPYTGETQYYSFLLFLKSVSEGMDDDAIILNMIINPGYVNIIKLMKDEDKNIDHMIDGNAVEHIAHLNQLIKENYDRIKDDFKYLTIFRIIYSDMINVLTNPEMEDNVSPEEANASGKFLLEAYECNPHMSNESYREFINALYESVFHFLFVSQKYMYVNHPLLGVTKGNYDALFRLESLFMYVPVQTKMISYVRSDTMNNIIEVTRDAVNHIMDFYWMIEPYNRLHIKEYMYLFEPSDEPI